MAFAISSGVTPQAGLYCAVVAGFLISALGGSRIQIGGPTGAFVVIVAGIVATHGVDGPVHVHADGRRDARRARRHRHGHRGQVHPAARRHRIYQRHRHADREHADQGLLRADDRRGAWRLLAGWTLAAHLATLDPATASLAAASLACSSSLARVSARGSRDHRRAGLGSDAVALVMGLPVDDDRHALRRHPERPAAVRTSRVPRRI